VQTGTVTEKVVLHAHHAFSRIKSAVDRMAP